MASPAKLSDYQIEQLTTAISTLLDEHLTAFKKELKAELISELPLQLNSKGGGSSCGGNAKEQEAEKLASSTLNNEMPSTIRSQHPLPPKPDSPTFFATPRADTAANVTPNVQNGIDIPAASAPKAEQHEHPHPLTPRLPTSLSPQHSATHPLLSQSPNIPLPSAAKLSGETFLQRQIPHLQRTVQEWPVSSDRGRKKPAKGATSTTPSAANAHKRFTSLQTQAKNQHRCSY